MTATALFDWPAANAMDAVSDRDFALEFLAAAAICAVHLSRFAEELVICRPTDLVLSACLMPLPPGHQLCRKSAPGCCRTSVPFGRIIGALNGLLIVYLPSLWVHMQEDKEGVFDAADCWVLPLPPPPA